MVEPKGEGVNAIRIQAELLQTPILRPGIRLREVQQEISTVIHPGIHGAVAVPERGTEFSDVMPGESRDVIEWLHGGGGEPGRRAGLVRLRDRGDTKQKGQDERGGDRCEVFNRMPLLNVLYVSVGLRSASSRCPVG